MLGGFRPFDQRDERQRTCDLETRGARSREGSMLVGDECVPKLTRKKIAVEHDYSEFDADSSLNYSVR